MGFLRRPSPKECPATLLVSEEQGQHLAGLRKCPGEPRHGDQDDRGQSQKGRTQDDPQKDHEPPWCPVDNIRKPWGSENALSRIARFTANVRIGNMRVEHRILS